MHPSIHDAITMFRLLDLSPQHTNSRNLPYLVCLFKHFNALSSTFSAQKYRAKTDWNLPMDNLIIAPLFQAPGGPRGPSPGQAGEEAVLVVRDRRRRVMRAEPRQQVRRTPARRGIGELSHRTTDSINRMGLISGRKVA